MRENIKFLTLGQVLAGAKPANTIVGNRKDNGVFFVAFVATDKESGAPLYDAENDKVRLNWRPSKRQQF